MVVQRCISDSGHGCHAGMRCLPRRVVCPSVRGNVSEDTYGMNEPGHATLFKRRVAAAAIRRILGGGVEIIRGRVGPRGRLVLNSLAARRRRSPQKAIKRR